MQVDILPLQETVSVPFGPVWIDSPPFVISKLHCYALCPVSSPSQLYCSAQVSANLLLSQTYSCAIYTITAGLWMGYSSTCLILAKVLNKCVIYFMCFVWGLWLETGTENCQEIFILTDIRRLNLYWFTVRCIRRTYYCSFINSEKILSLAATVLCNSIFDNRQTKMKCRLVVWNLWYC